MQISIYPYLGKKCVITGFDNLEGLIIGLNQGRYGTELQVEYFLNGEHRTEWFRDNYVELVEE